jgi:hypothetical protein
MRLFIIAICASLLLLGCSAGKPAPNQPRAEEYLALSVWIDSVYTEHWWRHREPPVQLALIADSTIKPVPYLEHFQQWPPMVSFDSSNVISRRDVFTQLRRALPRLDWDFILADFDSVNHRRYPLDSAQLRLAFPHKLVSVSHWTEIRDNRTLWRVSNGFIGFSRVGLNRSRDTALLYVRHIDIEHGFDEMYAVITRLYGKWKIEYALVAFTI